MKRITQNAVLIAASILLGTLSANAQWRWNPNNWGTQHATQGATVSVSADNKTFIVYPYANSTSDLTSRRGDIWFTKNVVLLESEPVVAIYMQFKNISLKLSDWKFDYIIQQQTAIAYDETTQVYTWGPDDFKLGGNKLWIPGLKGVSASCYTSDGADDLWIFDMTAGGGEPKQIEDAWLGNGDRTVNYAPTYVRTGEGVGAKQSRGWLGFVCIGTGATTNPTFNLKYCATAKTVNDVFGNIEAYLNSEGGQEVREGDQTAIRETKINKAIIYSGEGHIISPSAVSMEAYSVSGAKIKEVNANRMDLNAGIYMIKVTDKEDVVTFGKAIVR